MAPPDIHQHLLNVHGDQTAADVSTVRWWVVCFSSGNSKTAPYDADIYKQGMEALVHCW